MFETKKRMIDKLTSVLENYSQKIRNPLFGTIISVWLVHNWRIPFAIFNFDEECTLQDKINFIADYFGKQNLLSEIIDIVGYSFLILLGSYVLLMISRTITDFYYKIVEPFIITLIDKKAIYTIEEKTKLEQRLNKLNFKLNEKDKEIDSLESASTKLIRLIADKEKENQKISEEVISKDNSLRSKDFEIETLKQITEPLKGVWKSFDFLITQISDSDKAEIEKFSIVGPQFSSKNFATLVFLLSNNFIVEKDNKNLLKLGGYDPEEIYNSIYKFTDYGKMFVGYLEGRYTL